jgi:hypothetical protein
MRFTWFDCDTGEYINCLWCGQGESDTEKGFGCALTYAERYFMLKFFHIPTNGNDPDFMTNNNQQQTTVAMATKEDIDFMVTTAKLYDLSDETWINIDQVINGNIKKTKQEIKDFILWLNKQKRKGNK